MLPSDWQSFSQIDDDFEIGKKTSSDKQNIKTECQKDSNNSLPLTISEQDGKEVLKMYWLDALEDPFKHPGMVYLFGKVWIASLGEYVSCCVIVKNVFKRVFLLPRLKRIQLSSGREIDDPVYMKDVYEEFFNLSTKHSIMKFKSKPTIKKYAFNKENVPMESEYLEIRYSAEFSNLPSDFSGETFSMAFGTNTSSLEMLLLNQKIKGPCWLEIISPKISSPNISWCNIEVSVPLESDIRPAQEQFAAPPIVILSIFLVTTLNEKSKQSEIIGVSCMVNNKFPIDKSAPKQLFQKNFTAIAKPLKSVYPFDLKDKIAKKMKNTDIQLFNNERQLLTYLMEKFLEIDPDVIVGHDIVSFDIDVLLNQLLHHKIANWSRIGRLKKTQPIKMSSSTLRSSLVCGGRLLCDVMISAKELIRCRSYDLQELVSQLFNETRMTNPREDDQYTFNSFQSSQSLINLINANLTDASFILRIMAELNILPLALQITNICGNIMTRTLLGGRSERNEFLLSHAFHSRNFIIPDKSFHKKNNKLIITEGEFEEDKKTFKKKATYAGGLVLEPKIGFYDRCILLLDFNSLYPSIIQEYNICFTTIDFNSHKLSAEETESNVEDYDESLLPPSNMEAGVLPTEIRKLVESRKQVRDLMKAFDTTSDQYMQYDIRQKALKLTANSMYGCLGFSFSRYHARTLASLVTGKGREILLKTKDLVEKMNLEVIYGDTDSIMVNTGLLDIDEVFKIGNKVKHEVNKLYRLLEIDIDGVFKSMLLLKKKKYAALLVHKSTNGTLTFKKELKGLDIVRRDWCPLAKEAGNFVVDQILSGEEREIIVENIHSKLLEVSQKIKDGQLPTELFCITKQLAKNPEEYPDKNSQAHVQVALRYNQKAGRKLKSGDIVYYIICQDGTNLPPIQRSYHPDELSKREDLTIDTKYYLSQQIHPVVSRLCDPIDGTDASHIAEYLGLDPAAYRRTAAKRYDHIEEEAMLGAQAMRDDIEKFKYCEKLNFLCFVCKQSNTVESMFYQSQEDETKKLFSWAKCCNEQCNVSPLDSYFLYIQNKIIQAMRSHIKKYYAGWFVCEDPTCGHRTRRTPKKFHHGFNLCSMCNKSYAHLEYNEKDLYLQLCFYQSLFDFERSINQINIQEREIFKRSISVEIQQKLQQIQNIVDKQLNYNAYAHVNLASIFTCLFKNFSIAQK